MESKSTYQVTKLSFAAMGGVLLSRLSGVVRTIIVNSTFGVSVAMDAFNAAFRMPNSLRDLFADGALSAAFMTALVDEKQKGHQKERELIAIVLGFFITITILLALIGLFFSEQILQLITEKNFQLSGSLSIAVLLFRLLVFYLPITMLNAVFMAVLGVHEQSFRAMNGSIFLSVGMIAGAILFAPCFKLWGIIPVVGLAIGALLGAILQMFYQMYPLFSLELIPWPNFNINVWWSYKPLRKILKQMAPRALGQGALVIALAINTYFATQIGTGFLTYIVTAVTIIQVPIGLFGVATGFATLPSLTYMLAQRDSLNFSALLVEGLRNTFWLAAGTTFCFALLAVPFYVLLFQHGKVTYFDTINNSIAICMYATGIILGSANKILINSLYALNATRQIVYNAVLYLCVNTILNFVLVPKFGLIGIGFSFGIATSLDFWLNYFCIKRYFAKLKYKHSPYKKAGKYFTQKIFMLNVFSFVACFSGVWLIKHFWSEFPDNFHQLTFSYAFFFLLVGGSFISLLFLICIKKFGPPHLKKLLLRK